MYDDLRAPYKVTDTSALQLGGIIVGSSGR